MLEIYQASTENLRELKKQYKTILRILNQSLKNKRHAEIQALTKVFALMYSAYAEVAFLKTIHTPYGFNEQIILDIQSKKYLEAKWLKCIEVAFINLNSINNAGEIANKKQKLTQLLNDYVIKPSQIRNKIAHGQWCKALNSDSTAINIETTNNVNCLDFVEIDKLFQLYTKYCQIIEDLIESPRKAHYRFFYSSLVEMELYINKTNMWTIDSKKICLSRNAVDNVLLPII
jgi:hypothetical protein